MGYVTKWLIIEEFSIFLNHRILSEKWVGMLRIIHICSESKSSISSISSVEDIEDSGEMAETGDFGTELGAESFEAAETLTNN